MFDWGGRNKREVFIICTYFATTNLGTVGAVAAILGLLHIFLAIVLLYTIAAPAVAAVLIRIPPLSMAPNEYIAELDPESRFTGIVGEYLRFAFSEGVSTTANDDSIPRASLTSFIDDLKLAGMIVGSVLAMSMVVLLLEACTPAFEYITEPFVPLLSLFGIPDPKLATISIILGGAEFFVGSTFAAQADLVTQMFVLIVTGAQATFFSAPALVMVDMFNDVPMQFRDLFLLLIMHTVFLIPIATALTHAANTLGSI